MQLFFLLVLLVGPYVVLTLAGALAPRFRLPAPTRARVGLTLFFLFTSLGHFVKNVEMSSMLPPSVPHRPEIIYVTGVLEALGAIGVWIPSLKRLAGISLIVMLIGILPANIYSALQHVEFGGHGAGPIYLLVRIPFQILVIVWTYVATEQRWFGRRRGQGPR